MTIGSASLDGAARPHVALPLALAAGGVLALALPPVYLLPALTALALLFHQCRTAPSGGRAAALGFAFGFGFHLAGLYWVGIAFFAVPGFEIFAVPAVLGLVTVLAAIQALAALLFWRTRGWPIGAQTSVFALLWVATELLRTHLLKFPWNPLASVWAFSWPTLQPIAWIGVSALSLLTAALGVLPAWRAVPGALSRALLPAGAILLLMAGAALRVPTSGSAEVGPGVRIVQPNIPQHHKWDPEKRRLWLERHLELSSRPYPGPPPRLLLWPESAVPYRAEDEELRQLLARVLPPGGHLLFGADRYEWDRKPPELSNSLYLIDSGGQLLDRYDKVDLVPFGEFLPLRPVLRRLGLRKLTKGTIDFSPGPGRRTLLADGLPPLSPLICYEAAFPGRATDGTGRARLLVNVTNDAWFGISSGPYQHFALARMRAVETGLPLLRAANTGISAIIDGYGRIRTMLPLGVGGVLDGRIPPALTPPPIARMPGLAIATVFAFLVLNAAVDLWRRASQKERALPEAP